MTDLPIRTLDQIEEKERALNKLQRETSDRALIAGKLMNEKKEKKEKRSVPAKEPHKKPRTVASSLSAVTNILAVPTPSPPREPHHTHTHTHNHTHSSHSHSHSHASHSPLPPTTPSTPLPQSPYTPLPASLSGTPGLSLRRGSGAGEHAPAQPKSPKELPKSTGLSASSSDSMHMIQQRRLEREKEREKNSPSRTMVGTPPSAGLARKDEVRALAQCSL